MTDLFRWFGVIGFAITWIAISLMFLVWEVDKSKSISHHAAANKHSYIMMAIIESISLSMFIFFTAGWIAPKYDLSILFSILCTTLALGLILAAWVPVTGPKGKMHDVSAYGAALLFIPITAILATSPTIPKTARLISMLSTILMIGLIGTFALVKKIRVHHLYLQMGYILVFDLTLIAVAFLK